MRRSPSRLLLLGFMTLFIVLMIVGNNTTVDAQFPDENWINDEQDRLHVYIVLGGEIIKQHNLGNPITLDMEDPMPLYMVINATGTQTLNMSGSITFWYQGIAIFPIQIVDPDTNSTWVLVDPSSSIEPIEAEIDFSQMLSLGPISLTTGVFEATVDFRYTAEGNSTVNYAQHQFSFLIPSDPYNVVTSVTGISAIVATIGAVTGVGQSIFSLWDGLKTAYKLRGIHKKASELRSLPNLTVLSSLPLLFSMLDSMKKKKKDGREDSGVSEYIVRQRLREVAPDAWQADKCPKCKRKWNKKLDMCKKCGLSYEDARIEYADYLASKVPAAIRWLGKKKSSDVKTLAKKTKSTQYNAGVIAAAMVDTEVTEITKVGTPLRSFVFNIAGLAFLVVTWQQLLGDSTSNWQTSITLIGAAMSLAIIIALYVSRRAQIEKFVADQEEGKKMLPTEEEARAEAGAEKIEAEAKAQQESEIAEETSAELPDDTETESGDYFGDEVDEYSEEESDDFYSEEE